jgi:hypothetical protein
VVESLGLAETPAEQPSAVIELGHHVLVYPGSNLYARVPKQLGTATAYRAASSHEFLRFEIVAVRGDWLQVRGVPKQEDSCTSSPYDPYRWGVQPWVHTVFLHPVVRANTHHALRDGVELRLRAGAPIERDDDTEDGWRLIVSESSHLESMRFPFPAEAIGRSFVPSTWEPVPRTGESLKPEHAPRAPGLELEWGQIVGASVRWPKSGSDIAEVQLRGECWELNYTMSLAADSLGSVGGGSSSCGVPPRCRAPIDLPKGTAVYWEDGSAAGSTREPISLCTADTKLLQAGLRCVEIDADSWSVMAQQGPTNTVCFEEP